MADHSIGIYENLIDRYGNMVYKIAISHMRNVHDAEDVFQNVFVRLIKYSPEFADNKHEKAWLIRTTVNCCHDLYKSSSYKKAEELKENIPVSDEYNDDTLIRFVRQLPEKYRNVIHLFYYEDMSIKEIANALNQNENTVKSYLRRGKTRLKELIEQEGIAYEI